MTVLIKYGNTAMVSTNMFAIIVCLETLHSVLEIASAYLFIVTLINNKHGTWDTPRCQQMSEYRIMLLHCHDV